MMMSKKVGLLMGAALLGAALMTPGAAQAAQRQVLMEHFTSGS